MSIITWNDSFYIHVAEIDRQHKKLVGLINSLADAMSLGKGSEALGKIITELVDYTIKHFRTEESLLTRYQYPDTEDHMQEHSEFVDKVSHFKEEFENNRLGLTVEVLNFLCDWLRDHIKQSDMKIGAFLNEQGVN